MSILPTNPFDNQQYIDAFSRVWMFDTEVNCWKRIGVVNSVPVASSTRSGLLSKELKSLLDTVHTKGGGFAIVTKPHLTFRDQLNPDSVLFGDIELVSDSLEIKCVFADGAEIKPSCAKVAFKETDEIPPGFDINFSKALLNTLCVEVPGGPGPVGQPGKKGERGKDGTGDGPVGLQGESGINATTRFKLTGVKIVELDDVFDTAVAKLELDQAGGKLLVTKARLNLPNDDNAAAEQVVTMQISRDIIFKDCFDYEISVAPCRPDDDFDDPNPIIAYYPSHFDPEKIQDRKFQPVTRRLRDHIDDIIGYYQDKLNEVADQYDRQIDKFIKDKDAEARKQLDVIGDRLAECEHITYLEYCLAPIDCEQEDGIVEVPANRPECEALAQAVGCKQGICLIMDTINATAETAPVFSFRSVPPPVRINSAGDNLPSGITKKSVTICPDGCWMGFGDARAWAPPGGRVAPGWSVLPSVDDDVSPSPPPGPKVETLEICVNQFDQEVTCPDAQDTAGPIQPSVFTEWVNSVRDALTSGSILFKKKQFKAGPNSFEFPPGTYAFTYLGGAVRQDRLTKEQLYGEPSTGILTGSWTDYFVGNEGAGIVQGPYFVLDPDDRTARTPFNAPLVSTEIGLEIGFAPISYVNLIPTDFFTKHAYDPSGEIGNAGVELPFKRIDFNAQLTQAIIIEENKIQWKKFPTIDGNKSDSTILQKNYIEGLLKNRMIAFTTNTAGFFFARVKTAYSILNFFNTLIMPPVQNTPIRPTSLNKALVSFSNVSSNGTPKPFIDARPVGSGSIRIQVAKVECTPDAPAQPPPSPTTPSPPASLACTGFRETRTPSQQVFSNGASFAAVYDIVPSVIPNDGELKSAQIGMSAEDYNGLAAIGLRWDINAPIFNGDGTRNDVPGQSTHPGTLSLPQQRLFVINGTIKNLSPGQVVSWKLQLLTRDNGGKGNWVKRGECTFTLTGA
jgi:hypothetical protein